MFEHVPDPLARLEALEYNLQTMNNDKMQLVNAINHQARAMELMSQQIKHLITTSQIQDQQIKLLQESLPKPVNLMQQLGFK
jgi:hypothetical protein